MQCVALGRFSANWWIPTSFRFSNCPANHCLSRMRIVRVERVEMIVFVVVVVIRCSNPDVLACKVELLPSKGIVVRPYRKLVCVH